MSMIVINMIFPSVRMALLWDLLNFANVVYEEDKRS